MLSKTVEPCYNTRVAQLRDSAQVPYSSLFGSMET